MAGRRRIAALQQFFQQDAEGAALQALQRRALGTAGGEEGRRAEVAEAAVMAVDQQVVGVQVAVQDAAAMQVCQRSGHAAWLDWPSHTAAEMAREAWPPDVPREAAPPLTAGRKRRR